MENKWTAFLATLQELKINHAEQNPSDVYRDLQKSIQIEQVIGYDNANRLKTCKGVFHCALSVQVLSTDSGNNFIPFVYVLHGDDDKRNLARNWVDDSLKNKLIKYNYTDFFDDVRALINQLEEECTMQLKEGDEFSNITFKSEFSEKESRYTISNICLNSNHNDNGNEIKLPERINALLTNKGEGADFINVISELYYKKIEVQNLYFAIYGLDGDYRTGNRLTHFIIVADDKKEIDAFCVQNFHAGYIRRIRDIASYIRTRYIYDLNMKNLWEATKSAKAAIMSRNMSHNLGSHVMFYIKQKLQSVSKIVDNKVLDNIIPRTIDDIAKAVKIADVVAKVNENKDIELPFLVGLGQFINYLQERQDYIATIATDYIPANSTISFKDFVYDELKPELRYERHHPTEDSRKNDAGWQPGNLLLDYIAYSEGYRSCDDIEILFGEFDGRTPQDGSHAEKDFKKLREFNIAVPGGVIGRQAIFSIFENIIRNAAKHSERRNDNKLVLQLSLLDKTDALFQSERFISKREDNQAQYEKFGRHLADLYVGDSKSESLDKYHILRIKIDMPNDPNSVQNLVTKLADPYIEDGRMKETAKGLKEIRISAAWLRGYSIDTIIPATEPPAISIYSDFFNKNDQKDQRVTLSYILCIPKPCRVAFVKDEQDREYKTINEVLGLYGCKVFVNPFKLEKQEECDKLINEIANYEIVCMPKHLEEQLRSFVSSRCITDNETTNRLFEDLRKSTDKKVIDDLVGSIYEEWFRDAYNGNTPKLVIADGKAVQNKKKANGSLSCDSNVILTTTGMIADEDNTSNQKSVSGNNASISETKTTVTQEDVRGAVVYSTHFKGLVSKSEGPDGYNTWLQDAICIESVTGNNSTARLIRQDEWTKEWKTKILSAGMARVAIFDERIFSSFISRESNAKVDNLIGLIKGIKADKDVNEWKQEFMKLGIQAAHAIKLKTANEETTRSIVETTYQVNYQYDVAQKNHERRIWAFDMRIEANNTIDIIGYNVKIGKNVDLFTPHENDAAIPIAQISYADEKCEVKLYDSEKFFEDGKSNIFDYITIHQGVLDKIYTTFGIKDNATEKFKVTNALHRCFSKYHTPEDFTKFLPNFIIHSGRSKPSKADMPQPQPFVQFAAVDHAVKDCKYTLVELLATSHYEKGNNNN